MTSQVFLVGMRFCPLEREHEGLVFHLAAIGTILARLAGPQITRNS